MARTKKSKDTSLRSRIISNWWNRSIRELADISKIGYLNKTVFNEHFDLIIDNIYMYTRPKRNTKDKNIYLTELACAIGHDIRDVLRLKKNSGLAVKTGAFILYTFQELGIISIRLTQGVSGHNAYAVDIIDDDVIIQLWSAIPKKTVTKLPSETPFPEWNSTINACGAGLIKTANREVINSISVKKNPLLFRTINKAQNQGWVIDKEILDLQKWCLKNKLPAFNDIWEGRSLESRSSKIRETKTIFDIAQKFLDKEFYHLYYFDFRGRKYPATAYLHEQGSDVSRGMLRFKEKYKLGIKGFRWLMISLANTWAGDSGREDGKKTDKIKIQERYQWAFDRQELFMEYAMDPRENWNWMKADKPWQFISCCFELKRLREWQYSEGQDEMEAKGLIGFDPFENYEFSSNLIGYIDGSTNGSQHLAALTRDEVIAPHVNLIPMEYPGDLYAYVAEFVWEAIDKEYEELHNKERLEEILDEILVLKRSIINSTEHERQIFVDGIRKYKKSLEDKVIDNLCIVYWHRFTDLKERRKILKRNVMTIPYGGSPYGLG